MIFYATNHNVKIRPVFFPILKRAAYDDVTHPRYSQATVFLPFPFLHKGKTFLVICENDFLNIYRLYGIYILSLRLMDTFNFAS